MMAKPVADYALRTRPALPPEDAVEKVVTALKEEGFGVLTEVDVKATVKEKLNVDFRKYVIMGACNPPLAHQALSTDLDIGLLLPCNVIVYEDAGESVVAVLDPISMLDVVENPDLDPVAEEAHGRLKRVAKALEGWTTIELVAWFPGRGPGNVAWCVEGRS
jgi:uncharacterized protein (DUF302 family)